MSDQPLTPEELILQMTGDELQELLADLELESTPQMVDGIKRLVSELGDLESVIAILSQSSSDRHAA